MLRRDFLKLSLGGLALPDLLALRVRAGDGPGG
ncbi:uncharacterized protein METZ01_LOCUS403831, partial [marine metagenome]